MSKVQSGGLLIGIAILLNITGRFLAPAIRSSQNVTVAGLMALLMVASIVIGLFGLFRLVSGLAGKRS